MIVRGHVPNGVVVFENGASLPEGTRVFVSSEVSPRIHPSPARKPVALPIFDYDRQSDIDLTNDRIAELLDLEDASA